MELPRQIVVASHRAFYVFNAILSGAALAFLAYILLIHRGTPGSGLNLRFLPAVNASLNATSAVLLTAGYVFIRRRAVRLHQYCMVSAFVASSLFLVCYLLYHYTHGDTKFQGPGPIRLVYHMNVARHPRWAGRIEPPPRVGVPLRVSPRACHTTLTGQCGDPGRWT